MSHQNDHLYFYLYNTTSSSTMQGLIQGLGDCGSRAPVEQDWHLDPRKKYRYSGEFGSLTLHRELLRALVILNPGSRKMAD